MENLSHHLSGLGKLDRERLSAVMRGTKGTITNEQAARIMGLDQAGALSDPQLGGGIRSVQDMFRNYLGSDVKNLDQLVEYAEHLDNGAVFKRLSFLLEANTLQEVGVIETMPAPSDEGQRTY